MEMSTTYAFIGNKSYECILLKYSSMKYDTNVINMDIIILLCRHLYDINVLYSYYAYFIIIVHWKEDVALWYLQLNIMSIIF